MKRKLGEGPVYPISLSTPRKGGGETLPPSLAWYWPFTLIYDSMEAELGLRSISVHLILKVSRFYPMLSHS